MWKRSSNVGKNEYRRKMQVFKPLYTIMADTGGITDVVGDKIYYTRAAQNVAAPYVVINQISGVGIPTKSGPSTLDKNRVQIDVYSLDAKTVVDLAETIRQAIEYYQGDVGGVYLDGIVWDSEETEYDEELDLFRVRVDYFVRYKRIS